MPESDWLAVHGHAHTSTVVTKNKLALTKFFRKSNRMLNAEYTALPVLWIAFIRR